MCSNGHSLSMGRLIVFSDLTFLENICIGIKIFGFLYRLIVVFSINYIICCFIMHTLFQSQEMIFKAEFEATTILNRIAEYFY